MAIFLAASPIAHAASYTSTILYPLSASSGYYDAVPSGSGYAQTAAGGQVVGSATASGGTDHAFVWSGFSGSGTDLATNLPAGINKSYAQGTDGSQQVGYTEGSGGSLTDQAMLWSNSAGAMVDLNPTLLTGFSASEAFAVTSGQQVGYGLGTSTSFNPHAMLWTGNAASAVDLNPTNLAITTSIALGTDGANQVGHGSGADTSNSIHALLWSSTSSAVDLNPTALAFDNSSALGVAGNQEVGVGSTTGTSMFSHALLWTGTAASAVDLNPTDLTGIVASQANGTNGSQQVGFGNGPATGYVNHALLWTGTANSAVDLQSQLPSAGAWSSSYACTIDSSGNTFGIAQGTFNGSTGNFAVEWSPINSPSRTDIGTGFLDLPGGSLTNQTALVCQGCSAGTWNGGTGIMSSAAAGDTAHLTAVGIIQNNQGGSPIYSAYTPFEGNTPGQADVLIKYTWYGDTNLDGKVDGSDYSRIDSAYFTDQSSPPALTGWFNGDFNYDNTIDGSDYTLIDNAFNNQGAQLTAAVSTAQIAVVSAVPEPAAISLLILAAGMMLGRRRRSDRG